jgi:glycine hydroxymethyltransferase
MYLDSLRVQGFRRFDDISLRFKNGLNVIVGPNNAGKTAVVDALRVLLSASDEGSIRLTELDLHQKKDGTKAEKAFGEARITGNKNAIPSDPEKPFVTSGIRLGTPAMTTRGFCEDEARLVGNLVADVLDAPHNADRIQRVREQVAALTRRFPVYK